MKKFALACEGTTDKAVITNILRGYFSIDNPQRYIAELSPPEGGWQPLMTYLTRERFRDDVENHEFVILQMDSDITTKEEEAEKLGIYYKDINGIELTTEQLIAKIIEKLIEQINIGQNDFYQDYAEKIIFAISVHSIECWLVAHYAQSLNLLNCLNELKAIKLPNNLQVAKKCSHYERISAPFLDRTHITNAANNNVSLYLFIHALSNISL